MTTATKDYYETLGVPRDASREDIERAFRKLAKKHHPDANQGDRSAAARFQEVSDAYQTLKDTEKRKQYDSPEPDWRTLFGGPGQPGNGRFEFRTDVSPDDLQDLLGGMGGIGGFTNLHELLGGASSGRPRWGTGGSSFGMFGGDMEAELPLTLHEAHRGGTKVISVGGKRIEVNVPVGVTDGSIIRLAGQGAPGVGTGKPGDVRLRVKLLPDARFKVTGHELETEVRLAPWEAVLGAKVAVATLDGPVQLTVPAGTQSGRKLRLRGQGLNKRAGGSGDLYARVTVMVPTKPTPEEKRLLEELSRRSSFDPRGT